MASHSFQMDDNSDEDFFDKLADDDYQITKSDFLQNSQNFLPDSTDPETEATSVDNANDELSKLSLDDKEASLTSSNDSGKDLGIIECSLAESRVSKVSVESCDGKNAPLEGSPPRSKELSFAYLSQENVAIGSADLDSLETSIKPDNAEAAMVSFDNTNDGSQRSTEPLGLKAGESSTKAGNNSICTNVREVQWSNFNTISTRGDLGGFGSYSDFYTDLPGSLSEDVGGSGIEKFPASFQVENDSVLSRQPTFESTPDQASQFWENGTIDALVVDNTKPKIEPVSEAGTFYGPSNDMQNHSKHGELHGQFTGSISSDQSSSINAEQPLAVDGQNVYYNQSWEDAYPGWRYDPMTGAWHQLESYEIKAAGSSIEGEDNHECVQGGSENNSQSTLNDLSYSSWQEQGSQVYYGSSTRSSIDPASLTNTEEVHHLQQTFDSASGSAQATQGSSEQIVSDWQQYSQNVPENQQNIIFDPQYPGWYYDLAAQEWRQVADYGQKFETDGDSTVSTFGSHQVLPEQTEMGGGVSSNAYAYQDPSLYIQNSQFQGFQTQVAGVQWSASPNDYGTSNGQWEDSSFQQGVYGTGQAYPGAFNGNMTGKNLNNGFTGNQKNPNVYDPAANIQGQLHRLTNSQIPNSTPQSDQSDQSFSNHHKQFSLQGSEFEQNAYSYSQLQMDQNQRSEMGHGYYGNLQTADYSHQTFQVGQHMNHTPPILNSFVEGRSSAGRPPHALVTFGFGGKLVIVKPNGNINMESSYGHQDQTAGLITVHSLSQVVMENVDKGGGGITCSYFHTLCWQAFSNPLVGGSVASKEIFKWIDERIANCESATADCGNPDLLRLLLCTLRVFCQHYGKLRSTFGVTAASQETDGPEAALTKLFASAKPSGGRLNEFGVSGQCLQTVPSESQFQATALEMKNLLVAGKRKEALQQAQQGQLWGPALVLAWQLGEKFYVDTITQMAHRQFLPGSPLRTLCLLLAGQPAEVFSTNNFISSAHPVNSYSGTFNGMQASQDCISGMLDDWEENLAIIAANRTKGDERVIVHLGDCLWKERGEVAAAHTCYLVAEANFESFSDSARLCLLGADHWKFPRTYASPEAIQRTELFEYAKVIGNPQFILLPFQPYKLIYANMLAEVGKVSDSLRYCQAVSKTLKNAGRAAEVEACRQLASSLEDRIRIHTQGGYSSNLAPSKLVGRFLTSIDRSIHRIIGAPPPPMASDSQNGIQNSDSDVYSTVSEVANTTNRLGATALMPSASMEPISEWTSDNSRVTMQTRSVSEPDFSRSPKQEQLSFPSSKAESTPSKTRSNAAASGGSSRFGRFGSQILQKAVGFIAKAHHNEAKLGEKNKFYYDEKLKRWVEEGAAPLPEEEALSAPPTSAAFISNPQNTGSTYNISGTLNGQSVHDNGGSESRSSPTSEHTSGMPPVPPSMNQFSARGRLHGVRSRYVDTFNKGGGHTPSKSFQSPVIPAAGPGGLPPTTNFFVPTPAAFDPSIGEAVDMTVENSSGAACTSAAQDNSDSLSGSFQETSASEEKAVKVSGSMHRYSSADNVAQFADKGSEHGENGNVALSSRSRAASWSGGYPNSFKKSEEPEGLVTPEKNRLSKGSDVSGRASGYFSYPMKLEAQRPRAGGYVYASLPSPPSIEPPYSSMAIKNSLVTESKSKNSIFKKMDHGSESALQADSFGDDLQEVEL